MTLSHAYFLPAFGMSAPHFPRSRRRHFSLLALFFLFNSILTLCASAPAGPLDLSTTVHEYLRNGGHEKLQAAFNLSEHVYYNPITFFTREDGHERDGDRIVPRPRQNLRYRPSDLEMLRAMGLHVPGVDSDHDLQTVAREATNCGSLGEPPTRMKGAKSTIEITYSASTPDDIKGPIQFAIAKWTAEFESRVTIRLCFAWGGIGKTSNDVGETLGATTTPFFVTEETPDSKLRPNAQYTPALASALQGEDMIQAKQFHVQMMLNDKILWHLDTNTPAPNRRYDLATTVLHELTHGLFFSGTIEASDNRGSAKFMNKLPGRFDTFMRVENDIGVVKACLQPSELFNAVTSPNLKFFDEGNQANFGLYAPWPFASGSSLYHFNNTASLNKECEMLGIARDACSDLMTHELVYEYTQRSLGETTLRVYRSLRSESGGVPGGRNCDVAENSGRARLVPVSQPFNLPTWGIITVSVLGGLGVILVVGVIVSSIVGGINR